MGVHSLWEIVGPTARPVRLEALSRKKLAVDASIWIYQFLKAVRDKDGNSLVNSHIVGFFRRICKLLYFGILPVFVFDGGAPALKRRTIHQRIERRQGRRDNAQQTAQKLLQIQLQKLAEREHDTKSGRSASKRDIVVDAAVKDINPVDISNNIVLDENTVYFEDLTNQHPAYGSQPSRTATPEKRKPFRRQDEYHLPDIDGFEYSKNDKRMLSELEFQELTKGLDDDIDGIDLNMVDPASKEFEELPLNTQYMIVSRLRLRSRLRMGFTKEQLETLFPNSMEFSKFQVQMVQKRNFLTQKLMNVTGMNDTGNTTRRIAGDKDREYSLKKNADGWTLSLSKEGTSRKDAIVLDEDKTTKVENDDDDDDVEWEDVPIKGEENKVSYHIEQEDMINDKIEQLIGSVDSQIRRQQIMMNNRNKLEDEEEEELQRALITSVRDANFSELANLEEEQIRQAIEKSKADLKMKQNHQAKDNDTEFEFGNLGQGMPLGSPTPPPQTSVPTNVGRTRAETPDNANINDSFANSILFSDLNLKQPQPSSSKTSNSFSLGRSFLFPSLGKSSSQVEATPSSTPESSVDVLSGMDISTEATAVEDSQTTSKPVTMPSWFDRTSHVTNSANSGIGVLREGERQTADEAMGLISWDTAEQYIEETEKVVEADAENDSDVEVLEEFNDDDFEDVEIIEPPTIPMLSKGMEVHQENEQEIDQSNQKLASVLEILPNSEILVESPKPSTTSKEDDDGEEGENQIPENGITPGNLLDYDFSESEEEKLVEQLHDEELEHERFKATINPQLNLNSTFDEKLLQEQQRKDKRDSDEVTRGMINDVQELLRRFGIPYVTAPMEAEAQCAELLQLKLVDGIITDDSDCFLFGGDTIYKNMFNQKNYVECYFMNDVERDLGLNRQKLIELALLLGSDYTEGLKGVGKVSAMEILAEFEDLDNFKSWWLHLQHGGQIPKDENEIRKRLRKKFNGKLFLDNTFPEKLVYEAYEKPEVDHDKTEFKWGVPDLDRIRTFLMYNIGWPKARVDEVLVPLIKDMNRKKIEGTQSTLGEFFPREVIHKRRDLLSGKRLKDASNKLSKKRKTA